MAPLEKISDKKFNYADYLAWPDEERWEIIEGLAYDMSPSPSTEHQIISFRLSGILYDFLKDKQCKAFAAPFDVRLTESNGQTDEDIKTVVQPDLVVVCDQNKLDKKGCIGAPDVTVEILAPSTSYKDQTEKLMLYERYGVKEYWIFNPDAKYAMVYNLKGTKFEKPIYLTENETLVSSALPGLKIALSEVWAR